LPPTSPPRTARGNWPPRQPLTSAASTSWSTTRPPRPSSRTVRWPWLTPTGSLTSTHACCLRCAWTARCCPAWSPPVGVRSCISLQRRPAATTGRARLRCSEGGTCHLQQETRHPDRPA